MLYSYLRFIRLLIPINLRDLIFVNTSIGEKHQWMYDKYSLKKIFENLGFKNINVKKFNESDIPLHHLFLSKIEGFLLLNLAYYTFSAKKRDEKLCNVSYAFYLFRLHIIWGFK